MKMREIIIDPKWDLFEAAYPGNLGLMELVQFYKLATPEQKAQMDEVTSNENWDQFKQLIFDVLGIQLM